MDNRNSSVICLISYSTNKAKPFYVSFAYLDKMKNYIFVRSKGDGKFGIFSFLNLLKNKKVYYVKKGWKKHFPKTS